MAQTGTTVLSASTTSVGDGGSDTFTATVGASDNSTAGVTGAVEFLDGTTAIPGCAAQATTVTGAGHRRLTGRWYGDLQHQFAAAGQRQHHGRFHSDQQLVLHVDLSCSRGHGGADRSHDRAVGRLAQRCLWGFGHLHRYRWRE